MAYNTVKRKENFPNIYREIQMGSGAKSMHFLTSLGHKTTACGAPTPLYVFLFSSFLYLCKIKLATGLFTVYNQCSIYNMLLCFCREGKINILFYSILLGKAY
jgi:hypothetical protein